MGYQLFVGGTIAAKRIKTDTSDDNDCKLKLSIDFSLMSARVAGGTHVSQSCFVPGEQRSIRRGDKADEEDKSQEEVGKGPKSWRYTWRCYQRCIFQPRG